jgi:CRISPR-associated protein Cas2
MIFVIAYDLPSTREGDRRRAKVAKYLEGRGLRVQGSVFEIPLMPEKLPQLIEELRSLVEERTDSIRVYPLCASCERRIGRIGIDAPIERGDLSVW